MRLAATWHRSEPKTENINENENENENENKSNARRRSIKNCFAAVIEAPAGNWAASPDVCACRCVCVCQCRCVCMYICVFVILANDDDGGAWA